MEFDEIVVKESPGLCRCCLSEGCYKDMGTEYSWMNENEVYADMLLECFDISISQHNEGPNGPNRLICEVCITRLRDACYFKKQVQETEKKFIDMVARGEFRPKVLIYQTQMKTELEMPAEDAEVEYLEDEMDFGDDEPLRKSEAEPLASVSEVTADPLPIKGKRGRPKKAEKTEKKKVKLEPKAKTSKALVKELEPTTSERQIEKTRKNKVASLLRIIIEWSTLLPFRWHACKYMCFYCREVFVESSKLKEHVKEHSEVNVDQALLRTMYSNQMIKLDVTEIICTLCDTEFDRFDDYIDHLDVEHEICFTKDVTAQFAVFKLADNDMQCLQCGESFNYFNMLLIHTHRVHVDVQTTHKYLCEICGQGYAKKSHMIHHTNQSHCEQICKYCSKKFQTIYALDKHVGNVHKTEKLQCPICLEMFVNRYRKNRHLAIVHDLKCLQYVCDICNKLFTRKNKLDMHKRSVHFKEKNFSCEVCAMEVFDLNALRKHMVSHSDERPFQCDICKKNFSTKRYLVMHISKVHADHEK